jgi:ribonuclease J
MTVEICTVSGYDEVGRNMIAVKVDDEVIICDMGLHMENYVKVTQDEEGNVDLNKEELIDANAIPDDSVIKDWKKKVKAIIPGHAHLDHLGAIPFLASNYDAPVIATPYAISVLKRIIADGKGRGKLSNKLKTVEMDGVVKISKNIKVEFVNMTHSTPHTAMVVIHTPDGAIAYANDFKLDDTPTFGKPPNYKRIKEIAKEGVLAAFIDCTNADVVGKTPSERVAKEMLSEVIFDEKNAGRGLIVTTFASHIARLKTAIELGQKAGRKVVILGRSMEKYIGAAEDIGLVNFSSKAEIIGFRRKIKDKLRKIERDGKKKYLVICTGHQGEPRSVLSNIASGHLEFGLGPQDTIVFSCRVIPTPTNEANRERLEKELKRSNVRMFKEVHQSGHSSGQDLEAFVDMLKPKKIFPSHGEQKKKDALKKIAVKLGYDSKQVIMAKDGQRVILG